MSLQTFIVVQGLRAGNLPWMMFTQTAAGSCNLASSAIKPSRSATQHLNCPCGIGQEKLTPNITTNIVQGIAIHS